MKTILIEVNKNDKIKIKGNKIYITFDEEKTKMDLWLEQINIWLVEGIDALKGDVLSSGNLIITLKNKLKFNKLK